VTKKTYTVHELSERLRPVFISAPVYRAVLFGSYACGTATERSDVDVLIDSRRELRDLNFYGVLEDMVQALDKPVDLFEAAEIRPDSPIRDEIARRGIVLYGR
jgi:predicted nucleotidyltransferase